MENNSSQNNGKGPNNIPPPPQKEEMYLPIKFWLDLITHMDKKTQVLCENYGHGKIGFTIKVHRNLITDIEFTDDIRVKSLIEALGPRAVQEKQPEQSPQPKQSEPVK